MDIILHYGKSLLLAMVSHGIERKVAVCMMFLWVAMMMQKFANFSEHLF